MYGISTPTIPPAFQFQCANYITTNSCCGGPTRRFNGFLNSNLSVLVGWWCRMGMYAKQQTSGLKFDAVVVVVEMVRANVERERRRRR